jgi:hypothetical protein
MAASSQDTFGFDSLPAQLTMLISQGQPNVEKSSETDRSRSKSQAASKGSKTADNLARAKSEAPQNMQKVPKISKGTKSHPATFAANLTDSIALPDDAVLPNSAVTNLIPAPAIYNHPFLGTHKIQGGTSAAVLGISEGSSSKHGQPMKIEPAAHQQTTLQLAPAVSNIPDIAISSVEKDPQVLHQQSISTPILNQDVDMPDADLRSQLKDPSIALELGGEIQKPDEELCITPPSESLTPLGSPAFSVPAPHRKVKRPI